jgi:hypothetical protein
MQWNMKLTLEILSVEKIEEITRSHNGQTMARFTSDNTPFFPDSIFFSDDHFRLSLDKSVLKYHNLYDRFLLSKDQFEACFSQEKIKHIKENAQNNEIIDAYQESLEIKEKLITDLFLDEEYVIRRIAEIVLFYINQKTDLS